MTNLLQVLPDFDVAPYASILSQLEAKLITCDDLLTIDALDVAKRASVPPHEVQRLKDDVIPRLESQTEGIHRKGVTPEQWQTISALDDELDTALGGGVPAGYLSEVTGESAAGKTQVLLSLCLSVQLPSPHGLDKSALYITTEGPLQTTRLSQILASNPLISRLEAAERPSLARIHSIKVSDIEAQDHILTYQVPVAIVRHNVGLIVLDSVAANFRAEFDRPQDSAATPGKKRIAFAERNEQLVRLGSHLRYLAQHYNIVVVVANQILDRFSPDTPARDFAVGPPRASQSQPASRTASQMVFSPHPGAAALPSQTPPPTAQDLSEEVVLSTNDPLSLDQQQRFTTGWGSLPPRTPFGQQDWVHMDYLRNNLKTPSLGQVWTSQLSARIVLLKSPEWKDHDYRLGLAERDVARWRRWVNVAFAPWIKDDHGALGTEVEIWEGGVRAITPTSHDAQEEKEDMS